MAIEKLEVRITGNTDHLRQSLTQAKQEIWGFGKESKASMEDASSGTSSLTRSVVGLAAAYVSLGAAIKAARIGADLVMAGQKYNALLEQSQIGLAGIITSFGRVRSAQGGLLEGEEKWHASMRISQQMQERLQIQAMKTTAQYGDLVQVLNVALGPAMQAAMNPNQIVDFVTKVTQAANAVGIQTQEIATEIRAMFEGRVDPRSKIAQLLFSSVPTDNVRGFVRELKESGQFFDFMDQKLSGFARAGEELGNTYSGAISNLKDAWTQALGQATQDSTGRFTQSILHLRDAIVTFDRDGKAVFNQNLLDMIEGMAGAMSTLAERASELANMTFREGGTLDTLREWRAMNKQTGDVFIGWLDAIKTTLALVDVELDKVAKSMERFQRVASITMPFIAPPPMPKVPEGPNVFQRWTRFVQGLNPAIAERPHDAYGGGGSFDAQIEAWRKFGAEQGVTLETAVEKSKELSAEARKQLEVYGKMQAVAERSLRDAGLRLQIETAATDGLKQRLEFDLKSLKIQDGLKDRLAEINELTRIGAERRGELAELAEREASALEQALAHQREIATAAFIGKQTGTMLSGLIAETMPGYNQQQSIQLALATTHGIVRNVMEDGARIFSDRLARDLERAGERFARSFAFPAGDMLADAAEGR